MGFQLVVVLFVGGVLRGGGTFVNKAKVDVNWERRCLGRKPPIQVMKGLIRCNRPDNMQSGSVLTEQ